MGGPQSLKSFCYPCAVSVFSFLFTINSLRFNEPTLSLSFYSEFDLESYLHYYSAVEKSSGFEARRENGNHMFNCLPFIIECVRSFLSSCYEPGTVKGTTGFREMNPGCLNDLSKVLTTFYLPSLLLQYPQLSS